jgi:hypothetical protein
MDYYLNAESILFLIFMGKYLIYHRLMVVLSISFIEIYTKFLAPRKTNKSNFNYGQALDNHFFQLTKPNWTKVFKSEQSTHLSNKMSYLKNPSKDSRPILYVFSSILFVDKNKIRFIRTDVLYKAHKRNVHNIYRNIDS